MRQDIPDNQLKKNPVLVLVLLTSLGIGFGLFVSDTFHNFISGFGTLAIFCMIGLAVYVYQTNRRK